jgi:hypothetical protein
MDTNLYWLRAYADARLEQARAHCARESLLASVRRSPHGVLAKVGATLIRIGNWLRHRSDARRAPVPGLS